MKELVINKEDLKHNINVIKNIAKTSKIIAVVKGNGYGLGLIPYSKILVESGIEFLAVSTVEEALMLRENKIEAKILLLASTAIKEDVEKLVQNDIILTIGSKEAVDVAEQVAIEKNKKIKAHIKIDTGFGRYGFVYTEKEKIVQTLKNLQNIQIEGVFSHFSMAFFKTKYSKLQFKRFMEIVETLKENNISTGMLHICNSSAFLKFENMRLDAVRIGSAFLGRLAIPNIYGLRKIAYLKSNIAEIKTVPKGYNIGYSNAYKTKKETKIAIVPCGYADGYNVREERDMFRKIDYLRYMVRDFKDSLKNNSLSVNILNTKNSQKEYKTCNIIGRIGMYNITVDITGTDIQIGDEVELNINPMFVDSSIKRNYIIKTYSN